MNFIELTDVHWHRSREAGRHSHQYVGTTPVSCCRNSPGDGSTLSGYLGRLLVSHSDGRRLLTFGERGKCLLSCHSRERSLPSLTHLVNCLMPDVHIDKKHVHRPGCTFLVQFILSVQGMQLMYMEERPLFGILLCTIPHLKIFIKGRILFCNS